ncbi:60S ribosomal protein L30 [Astathelohania contejeani]|uniref:60S ribosomal protein L30 n=1 Tax=Astathelohania contejeani TaxID=164912 RepID=A0ABQ7HX90_9MICR|nr:60S ribosomal protein L30 [Thelohania contejeani]
MSRKKKVIDGIAASLPLVMKTGEYKIGYRQVLATLVNQKAKLIIISSNYPSYKRRLLEYYCTLANNTPILIFEGTNNNLAKACNKVYRVGVLSIIDEGESDIITGLK